MIREDLIRNCKNLKWPHARLQILTNLLEFSCQISLCLSSQTFGRSSRSPLAPSTRNSQPQLAFGATIIITLITTLIPLNDPAQKHEKQSHPTGFCLSCLLDVASAARVLFPFNCIISSACCCSRESRIKNRVSMFEFEPQVATCFLMKSDILLWREHCRIYLEICSRVQPQRSNLSLSFTAFVYDFD